MNNRKELCFAVIFDKIPMSFMQSFILSGMLPFILTSQFVYLPPDPIAAPRKKVNDALTKMNSGLEISEINCSNPVSTWFAIRFMITDMEKSRDFFRRIVDDPQLEKYLQDFNGDCYRANVIRYTFHDKLCRGLNRFFEENSIDWRIKKIESPGG